MDGLNNIYFFFQVFIQHECTLLCWFTTETYLFALTTANRSGLLREFNSVFHVAPGTIKFALTSARQVRHTVVSSHCDSHNTFK